MTIISGYDGCHKEEIKNMSKKELQKAIIRVFSLQPIPFKDKDPYSGEFLLEDNIADAFRNKVDTN